MIDEKAFDRLQKLACINLDKEDKKKLLDQLDNIIIFLDNLKNIDTKNVGVNYSWIENSLRTLKWLNNDQSNYILTNVEHNKINNNIIIKSVLS